MLLVAWLFVFRDRRANGKARVTQEAIVRYVDTEPPSENKLADETMKLGKQVTVKNSINAPKLIFAMSSTSSKFCNST